ncbi:hypothetical protein Dred_2590 [Desulforamulus reducens MI-1]|uniref:Uncharacterized protein n=1 Tax=Desulforamulus reducens (strain ATCC BAA-1160 / DSM 100696 / MI-1) TaxID=349161 RepID=A4J7P7_DESRM|nr:hypothetical protein [Desulforamulus reducens]ABO51100.1 hypothetical protein Dred_2590 [Desulforamulus reducens MI-1]
MSFFHRLEKFSFKDFTAIFYHGLFFFLLYKYLDGNDRAEALLVYVAPIVGAIITYYFATEGATLYFNRKKGEGENETNCP